MVQQSSKAGRRRTANFTRGTWPSVTSVGDVVASPISSLFLRTATARTTRSSALCPGLRRTT
nr:hypothetical protein JVH1_8492 [Rhodococcus sp. JVH1]